MLMLYMKLLERECREIIMEVLIVIYIVCSWILLACIMWGDWYHDKIGIKSSTALVMLMIYIIFMPIMWLARIGRT